MVVKVGRLDFQIELLKSIIKKTKMFGAIKFAIYVGYLLIQGIKKNLSNYLEVTFTSKLDQVKKSEIVKFTIDTSMPFYIEKEKEDKRLHLSSIEVIKKRFQKQPKVKLNFQKPLEIKNTYFNEHSNELKDILSGFENLFSNIYFRDFREFFLDGDYISLFRSQNSHISTELFESKVLRPSDYCDVFAENNNFRDISCFELLFLTFRNNIFRDGRKTKLKKPKFNIRDIKKYNIDFIRIIFVDLRRVTLVEFGGEDSIYKLVDFLVKLRVIMSHTEEINELIEVVTAADVDEINNNAVVVK